MKEASANFLGSVTEAVHGDFFRVALDSGHRYWPSPQGSFKFITYAPQSATVKVEISPYDPERGRIIQRL